LTYFHLKVLIDVSDIVELKAITIGTSGGLIFALLLGTLVAIAQSFASQVEPYRRLDVLATLSFLLLSLAFAASAFGAHLASVRHDIFLVDIANRKYQRAGDFVVILALIISFITARLYRHKTAKTLLQQTCTGLALIVYILTSALLLITSQLMGSNKGFAVTLVLVGGTLIWIVRPSLAVLRWTALLVPKRVNAIAAFGKSLPKFVVSGAMAVAIAIGIVRVSFTLTALGPERFRIFGFTDGTIGADSLAGRFQLLSSNFLTQLAVNPIFGDLEADDLTTGQGTYAHSLISLLSHLGIVGALLFSVYLFVLYTELKKLNRFSGSMDDDIEIGVYKVIMLGLLLCFALVSAFFTWMPLWFGLGLLCPAFVVRPRRVFSARSERLVG
jgi:hypothetical protein